MKQTALVAISTPLDEYNFYSKLINKKDTNGNPFFNTIRMGSVCEPCQLLDYHLQLQCDHVEQVLPPTHDHKRHKRIKQIYPQEQAARALREVGAVIATDFQPAINKEYTYRLGKLPRFDVIRQPRHIFITVDPNGGGPSALSIISACRTEPDNMLVVSDWLPLHVACHAVSQQRVNHMRDVVYVVWRVTKMMHLLGEYLEHGFKAIVRAVLCNLLLHRLLLEHDPHEEKPLHIQRTV